MDETAYNLLPQVELLIKNGTTDEEQIIAFFKRLFADTLAKADANATEFKAISHVCEEMLTALSEILELYREKLLFTEEDYEEYLKEVKNRPTVVKALCLHVAHACNLKCRYCFADEGGYHGEHSLMDFSHGKRALDFLVENSGNRRNLEVDFFGGEPLLNWDVVKELITYGRSLEKAHNKVFRFTLTTNGVLLREEMFDFINREINNVVLSIDGRKEINDRMRPMHDGSGSYGVIIDNFRKLAESRKQANYYVRGTFTRYNLDFTEDVKHLADLGFKQISIEPAILTEPLSEADSENDFAIRPLDIEAILHEYDRLALEVIERYKAGEPINFFHFMIDLTGGPCVAKRLSGCGAGCEYLAVTPEGLLYPCHQFVGTKEFLLGNIDDGIQRNEICDKFKAVSVYTKPKCRECFARFYCSGGCAANADNLCGDLNDCDDLSCTLQRKRVECAIMIKAFCMGG